MQAAANARSLGDAEHRAEEFCLCEKTKIVCVVWTFVCGQEARKMVKKK